MRLFHVPLIALGLLAACGDGSTDPNRTRSGSLSFSYSGSGYDGTFSASGALDLDAAGQPRFGSYAFAARDETGADALVIAAFQARSEPRGDAVIFLVEPESGTGDYSLNFECDPEVEGRCAPGLFALDVTMEDAELGGLPEGEVFFYQSGTFRITRITDRVVEGTFSGTGVFVDFTTFEESGPVQVTGGRFELPILRESELGGLAPSASLSPALSRARALTR